MFFWFGKSSSSWTRQARDDCLCDHAKYQESRRDHQAKQAAILLSTSLHIKQMDVAADESVETCIKEIVEKEGRIDVLVNNAGVSLFGSIESISMQQAQDMFNTNFFGILRTTKAVLPLLKSQRSGQLIYVSS